MHSEIESVCTLYCQATKACKEKAESRFPKAEVLKDATHLSMHRAVGRAGEIRRQRLGGGRPQRLRRHRPPGLRWRHRRRRGWMRSRPERRRRETTDLRRGRHLMSPCSAPRSRESSARARQVEEAGADCGGCGARVCGRESAPRREGFRKIFRRGRGGGRGPVLYTPQREKEEAGPRARCAGRGPHDASNPRFQRPPERAGAWKAPASWHEPVSRCSVGAQTSVAADDLMVPHVRYGVLF